MPNQNKQESWQDKFRYVWEGGNNQSLATGFPTKVMDEMIKDIEQTIHQEVSKVKDIAGAYMDIIDYQLFLDEIKNIHPTNNTKETKCKGNCPNTCVIHQGQYAFCSNPKCICHLNTKEE